MREHDMRERSIQREFLVPEKWSAAGEPINICAEILSSQGSRYYTGVRRGCLQPPHCRRRSVPRLTTPDKLAINSTLDIRLVMESWRKSG